MRSQNGFKTPFHIFGPMCQTWHFSTTLSLRRVGGAMPSRQAHMYVSSLVSNKATRIDRWRSDTCSARSGFCFDPRAPRARMCVSTHTVAACVLLLEM